MDLNENTLKIWQPLEAFYTSGENIALVILNQQITKQNEMHLKRLWKNASVKLCVDGGANQLYNWAFDNNCLQDFKPDYICGDLDSVEPKVQGYFQNKGTKCVRLADQDMTDFTKTLRFLVNCVSSRNLDQSLIDEIKNGPIEYCQVDKIYCFCEFTGRLDHALANLNTLYDDSLSKVDTFIVSSESITFLLKKGLNLVYIDENLCCNKYCGLFPLAESATVSTFGLKWNLNKQSLKFGSFVSSSNEFYSNEWSKSEWRERFSQKVPDLLNLDKKFSLIETDKSLLFTMSIIV